MTTVAVTGATGFVGQALLAQAARQGVAIQAITRRPQVPCDGVTWIDGALERAASLAELVAGADAVIHVAGVVNAPDRAAFEAGNSAGTAAVVLAAQDARVARFIQVSSLSAREPGLSDYGWSKAQGEKLVEASGLDWTIVRPPAIYGAGDREMLDLFKMAKLGVVPLPPKGRLSVIEVGDLARLLLALVGDKTGIGRVVEPDDGVECGWRYEDFARAIGDAVRRKAHPVHLPRALLGAASRIDRLLRRGNAKLTADRVRYMCHPDWTVDPERRPDPALWRPEVDTRAGLAATACWYREKGWL